MNAIQERIETTFDHIEQQHAIARERWMQLRELAGNDIGILDDLITVADVLRQAQERVSDGTDPDSETGSEFVSH